MNETIVIETEARINHPVYRDVYNTTFERGIIEDIKMLPSGKLNGMCKVVGSDWLPIFYHCKEHCYTEEVTSLEENESLNGGVMAFEIGHPVKVLQERGMPKFVVDHAEQFEPPYMCADVFRIAVVEWSGSQQDMYFVCSEPRELTTGRDHYGDVPNCIIPGIILFGKREFQRGTIVMYWGDRFIKVGPVYYIVRIDSMGMPGPITKFIIVYKGVWSQEAEDECIRLGAASEGALEGGIFDPMPIWPVYPDVVEDHPFTALLHGRFSGFFTLPSPRWIYTRFFGQSYEVVT